MRLYRIIERAITAQRALRVEHEGGDVFGQYINVRRTIPPRALCLRVFLVIMRLAHSSSLDGLFKLFGPPIFLVKEVEPRAAAEFVEFVILVLLHYLPVRGWPRPREENG